MASKDKVLAEGEFHLELRGGGLSLDRIVNEAVAQHIVAVVMTGAAPAGQGGGAQIGGGIPAGGGAAAGLGGQSPKAFLAQKRPATDIERIVCLAYYLTNSRDTPAFKTKVLTDLNREAAQPKLSNPSATARNANNDGYLAAAGGGQKQITVRGDALVEALPDREKVKAALEAHPARRRKPTAKKAKK